MILLVTTRVGTHTHATCHPSQKGPKQNRRVSEDGHSSGLCTTGTADTFEVGGGTRMHPSLPFSREQLMLLPIKLRNVDQPPGSQCQVPKKKRSVMTKRTHIKLEADAPSSPGERVDITDIITAIVDHPLTEPKPRFMTPGPQTLFKVTNVCATETAVVQPITRPSHLPPPPHPSLFLPQRAAHPAGTPSVLRASKYTD